MLAISAHVMQCAAHVVDAWLTVSVSIFVSMAPLVMHDGVCYSACTAHLEQVRGVAGWNCIDPALPAGILCTYYVHRIELNLFDIPARTPVFCGAHNTLIASRPHWAYIQPVCEVDFAAAAAGDCPTGCDYVDMSSVGL